MRTETIEIFKFSELSDTAKDRARDWFRSDGDAWGWASEWIASARAFENIAPIKIRGWDMDRRQVWIEWIGPDYASRYDHSDAIAELTGSRAWKWLTNNNWFTWARAEREGECSLTGFCADCTFADALKEYENHPARVPALKQVFYEMAQSWVSAAQDDCDHANSDEAVSEMIEWNEYEFDENGNFYG